MRSQVPKIFHLRRDVTMDGHRAGFKSQQDLPTPSTPELMTIYEKIPSLIFKAFILEKILKK